MKVIITQEELNAAVISFFGLPLDATVVLEGHHTSEQPVTQSVTEEVVAEEVKQVRTRKPRTKKQEEEVIVEEITISEPEVVKQEAVVDIPVVESEAIEIEVDTIKETEKKSDSPFQQESVDEDQKPSFTFDASAKSPFSSGDNQSETSDSKATPVSKSPFFFNVSEEEKSAISDTTNPFANAKPLFG